MKGKTKTTKGKIKCVTTTTKRVTSTGESLPKGVYISNTNSENVTYRAVMKGKYLGSYSSINKAKKAIKAAQ